MSLFVNYLWENPVYFFTVIISVSLSVCIHEFFHAYVALKCGDPTAAQTGHLTLNPLKQMGIFSLIMLLLLGICWGAVPVNPHILSKKKRIVVSLAGPAANLLLFILGMAISIVLMKLENDFAGIMLVFSMYNLVLCIFNLMPVPGLDGGNVIAELIPMNKIFSSEAGKGVVIGLILALFYFADYIFTAAEYIVVAIGKFFMNM